ncbi:MAG: histidine kinase dimerization/phospho-acceptor domain-containing protein, partial [Gemmatimonadales bacterium]
MRSIRGRLAAWFAVAMGATVLAFAGSIYLVQRAQSGAELDSRVRLETNLIARILSESFLAGEPVVIRDAATGQPSLAPDVSALFEGVQGFVMVLLRDGDVLFVSPEARALRFPALPQLSDLVGQPDAAGTFGFIDLGAGLGKVRYYVRPVTDAGPDIGRIVVGISTSGAELGLKRLVAAMLLIAPVVVAVSTLVGYALVGRALEPVDSIVDEVEAITDGRSLHRRLAAPNTGDELARLTTTLNQMLVRLERSFALLRRFTADASHELKTPLTVLRSGIERAITHPKVPPDLLEVLEETLMELNRMTEMVDSLLTLARVDEGRAPLHLDEVDLREILSEVAETANILGEQATVQVAVDVPREPVIVQVDRSRVRQLLMNLLTNAIKYTPPGGNVWINSATPNGQVV